jgi:hypothetical protein
VSQPKICDFSGKTFKGFEVVQFPMSTKLLSSGEFRKLRYDTVPASANVSFYTNNSKNAKFLVVTLLLQMRDMSPTCTPFLPLQFLSLLMFVPV